MRTGMQCFFYLLKTDIFATEAHGKTLKDKAAYGYFSV